MTPINTLYITYDGLTDPLGQSQIIPYLEGVQKTGYQVTIISCEKQEKRHLQESIRLQLAAVGINWIPLNYTKKPPVLSTVLDVRNILKAARAEYKRAPYSIVHCRSYISSLVGLRLKKLYGIKFIFDMRGFWADERVEGNLWPLSNPLYRRIFQYFKKKEKEFLTSADYIISLTENARNEIQGWKDLPGQPLPIKVIPCCVDMQLFDRSIAPVEKVTALKQKLNISHNDFVISYIGSLGTWYLLNEMLDFFKKLLTSKPDAKFLFITNNPAEDILGKTRSLNIPDDRIIITTSPRKEMPLYILCSHLSIFFIRQSFSKKASSPVKQGEVMSMGIPIICNAGVGDTDTIIEQSGAGIVIKDFSEEQFALAVNGISELMTISPLQIRKGAEQFYSLENGIKSYVSVYELLLRK